MKLTLAEIKEVKDLVEMKLNTYYSRVLDILLNCKHPHNLTAVAEKLGLEINTKEELIEHLVSYRKQMLIEIKGAEHPHVLVDLSAQLDKLVD